LDESVVLAVSGADPAEPGRALPTRSPRISQGPRIFCRKPTAGLLNPPSATGTTIPSVPTGSGAQADGGRLASEDVQDRTGPTCGLV